MSVITEKKPLIIQIPGERTPNELPLSASAVGYDFVEGNYIIYSTGSDSWVTAPEMKPIYWQSDVPGNIFTTGSIYVSGSVAAKLGFSGSLTKLTDGTSYIIGGNGISVASASNGAITIAASTAASTLQQTYNAGPATIGLNNLTGSFAISGALSQIGFNYPPLVRLEPGKGGAANYSAIDILGYNGATSASLINIRGNGSTFGGAEIMMRSTGGSPSKLTWFSGAGELYGSTATAEIYYHPNDSTLYFDIAGAAKKYIMKDSSGQSGTGNVAEFLNATTSFGGTIRFFTGANTRNAIFINSGSLEQSGSAKFYSGLSGSLTKLTDGTSYIIAGTGITVASASNGAITISATGGSGLATGKQYIAGASTSTTTSPLMIGQFAWVPADYTGLTSVRVRAIMATDGTANHTGSLQIYNLTSGSYLDLVDTPSSGKYFTITGSTPTLVSSSNLLTGITNFNNSSTSVYEVRVSGSTANNVIIGGVELIFS
jgi:hypothetical protein